MQVDPRVTVLMSVYNGEKYIREAIESILDQTYKNFEFLIINDGSIDSCKKIILSYKDPRIRLVDNKQNIGLTRSLNRGLKLATGEYIARQDADDISLPKRLEIQYDFMEQNHDVGVVGSWNEVIDDNGNTIDSWKCNYSSEDIYYILNFRNCLTHCSVLFRKDLIITNGGYNETINAAQDYELWNRISKVANIYQIQELLVKWRLTNSSISSKKRNSQMETVNNVFRNNLEQLLSEKVDENVIYFIKNNFENHNLVHLDIPSKEELLYSIKLINRINNNIINEAPHSLNKEKIKKFAENKFINYLHIASLEIGLLNSIRCMNNYIENNISLRIKIMILLIYKKFEKIF